jgi:hypothetical protein
MQSLGSALCWGGFGLLLGIGLLIVAGICKLNGDLDDEEEQRHGTRRS